MRLITIGVIVVFISSAEKDRRNNDDWVYNAINVVASLRQLRIKGQIILPVI